MWFIKPLCLLLGAVAVLAAAPVVRGQTPRLLRERAYGSTRAAQVNDVKWLMDGRILAAGPTQIVGAGWQTHVLVLDGNTLDTLWTRAGITAASGDVSVYPTSNGGVGYWGNAPNRQPDWAGQRFTAAGTSTGQYQVPNPIGIERQFGNALPAEGGDHFLVGTAISPRRARGEVVRVDSLGNLRWTHYYGWNEGDYLTDIAYTNTGTLLLAGLGQPYSGAGYFGLKLVEVTPQGDSVRGAIITPFGPGLNTIFRFGYNRILPLVGGDFLLACDTDSTLNNRPIFQPVLVRLTRQLQVRWARRYPPQPLADCRPTATAALADGSLLLLTYRALPQAATSFELLRVDGASGRLLNRYTLPSQLALQRVAPYRLIPDPAGGGRWLVAGSCERGYYLAHLDLSGLPSAVTAATVPAPTPAAALQVYPNPATAQATVQVLRPGTLRLRDALGRVVAQQPVRAGQNRLDLARLPAGLYACQLEQDGRVVAVQRLQVVH